MRYCILIFAMLLANRIAHSQNNAQAGTRGLSEQLTVLPYEELPLGAIQPEGWLRNQLRIMSVGSTGHLDETYSSLKDDNGWLGGKGDDWEETPYWLDGALPLAWLLNDDSLKKKVQKYIDWTLSSQRASGFFGAYTKDERLGKTTAISPEYGSDWWPRMIMLKVLQQYYSATGDERVIGFMRNYFRYQLRSLKNYPLDKWTDWAKVRGGENMMSVYWLYRKTGDAFLLELGDLLYSQTTPWTELLGKRDWVMLAAAQQNGTDWMNRHGVNVAMGLKLPAIYYQFTKNVTYLDSLKRGYKDLMLLHGLPNGMFSSDEDLHGNLPTQATELCAIVETMFSLEKILGITGDNSYADAIERIAFNALPAQTTDDYSCRQYFQIANQVVIKRTASDFSLPFEEGMNNVFGPYAGYTCCTANMHQGWPKFSTHLWYKTSDKGLAAMLYSPCSLSTVVGDGDSVTIKERTNYPFDDVVTLSLSLKSHVKFPLKLRMPIWSKETAIWLNGTMVQAGKAGEMVTISREWKDKDSIEIRFQAKVTTSNWARNSRTVERGPLVYALKIKEDWRKNFLSKGSPSTDELYYEVFPESEWNFGVLKSFIDDPHKNSVVLHKKIANQFVWNDENSPFRIILKAKRIPGWKVGDNGIADLPVTTRSDIYQGYVDSVASEITLVPYGFTKLRIVAFPVVK